MQKIFSRCACRVLLFNTVAMSLAWAQQGPDTKAATTQTDDHEQEEETHALPAIESEVTVTATRNTVSVEDIGFSTTIIKRQDIEAQGARTVAQALEAVPGFSVVQAGSYGGQTSLFVRGGESDFNLVLMDGVQLNEPGGAIDLADLSTSNVERIEVIRGPGSVIHGSGAVTSTINIITRQGTDVPRAEMLVEGGTFDTYLGRGSVSGGSPRVGYSLSGVVSDTNGFLPFNSGYEYGDFSGRFDFQPSRNTTVMTALRYNRSEQEFPTDSTGAVVDPNDFRRSDRLLYTVRLSHVVNSRYTSSLQYGFHERKSDNFTVADGVTDFFDFNLPRQDRRNTLDWQNDLSVGSNHLFTMGLTYEREEVLTDSADRRSVGIYVQDQFITNGPFSLTAGIRFDENDRFQNFVSANLSASLKVSRSLRLRGSVGNGLRAPSFDEILGFPSFGIQGNPNLKPEENVGLDGGLELRSEDGNSGFSATLFRNRFRDLIEFTFGVEPGTPNYLNVEEAHSQGIELEGFRSLSRSLRVGANYTFTDTEVTESGSTPADNFVVGESLLRRPRHTGDLYVSLSRRRYTGRIDFKYKGARDDRQFFPDFSSARVELPAYWRVDFGFRCSLFYWRSDGDLALTVRGENIFDRQYQEVAGFASPGRRLMAGLGLVF